MSFKDNLYTKTKLVGFTQQQTKDFMHALAQAVAETLSQGDTVRIADVGQIKLVERKAQLKHNPSTGGKIEVPAGQRVKFTASSGLMPAVESQK